MAAKRSIIKETGCLIHKGESSERKIAIPMLKGRAKHSARVAETKVPHINGKAPNMLLTGSQTLEKINLNPKASNDNLDEKISLNRMPITKSKRIRARKAVKPLNALSLLNNHLSFLFL